MEKQIPYHRKIYTRAVIKWMEYIKLNKNFIFSSIFRYLHKYLCFHAGNSRYRKYFVKIIS